MKKYAIGGALVACVVLAVWWLRPHTVTASTGEEFTYLERRTGSAGQGALPLVLALHGNGDSTENFYATLLKGFGARARFLVIEGPIKGGSIISRRAFWPTDKASVQKYGDALVAVLPALVKRYQSSGKPVLLGFSGGAVMAYYLAARHHDRFAYLFPLSGKFPEDFAAQEIVPAAPRDGAQVVAFHGQQDSLIAYAAGEGAVQALQSAGLTATLHPLQGNHLEVFTGGKAEFTTALARALAAPAR